MTGTEPMGLLYTVVPAVQAAGAEWPDVVIAVSVALLALMGLGAGVMAIALFRTLGRLVRSLEETVDRLAPRAEPLLDRAGRVAEDAQRISADLRGNAERLSETVDDLNDRIRTAARDAEARVRRLGDVLRVVQDETEDVLLDFVATARGLQTTATELGRIRDGGADRRPRRSGD